MKNKLIIFDIDDTLYNEIDYVKSGYKVVSKYIEEKYDIKGVYDEMMKLFDDSSKRVFNRLLDEYDIKYSEDEVRHLVSMYRDHKPDIALSEKTINVLRELRKNNKLAIVSDGDYSAQKRKCESALVTAPGLG